MARFPVTLGARTIPDRGGMASHALLARPFSNGDFGDRCGRVSFLSRSSPRRAIPLCRYAGHQRSSSSISQQLRHWPI